MSSRAPRTVTVVPPAGAAAAGVASGRHPPIFRIGRTVSIPVGRRSVIVIVLLLVGLLVLGVLTLTLGTLGIAVLDLVPAMFGQGTATDTFILGVLRGPRLVVAVAAGAAFGVSGALFQTVTRNPLGSPDVIGLSAGAGAGAAAFGLLWPGIIPIPVGALIGALVAMALVFIGTGRGFSSPGRVILVGIGVSAMALAFIQYAISRAVLEQATVITAFLNGSLAARSGAMRSSAGSAWS